MTGAAIINELMANRSALVFAVLTALPAALLSILVIELPILLSLTFITVVFISQMLFLMNTWYLSEHRERLLFLKPLRLGQLFLFKIVMTLLFTAILLFGYFFFAFFFWMMKPHLDFGEIALQLFNLSQLGIVFGALMTLNLDIQRNVHDRLSGLVAGILQFGLGLVIGGLIVLVSLGIEANEQAREILFDAFFSIHFYTFTLPVIVVLFLIDWYLLAMRQSFTKADAAFVAVWAFKRSREDN